MTSPHTLGRKELERLIIHNIPRDAFMACEDAYYGGDVKGRSHASIFERGHRPSAAGSVKHFFINESFHEALVTLGAEPTPLRGTRLVVGRLGIFNVARLNVPGHKWVNLQRSATRKKLAELNDSIGRKYVQNDFFAEASEPTGGTIFIVGVMDGQDENGISQLTQVMLALPAADMKSWLYMSTIADFLKLYDRVEDIVQPDNAKPKLKPHTKKQTDNDQGNQ
ncbi:alpha/beta hydrolase [Herbaspirillum sp. NPDC101397]|uniref:alpha/beta hydrolase n=1 Tax=Herbaspirillum sp. NPDC101397 TaxID=3364006 RepID=UPI00383A4881